MSEAGPYGRTVFGGYRGSSRVQIGFPMEAGLVVGASPRIVDTRFDGYAADRSVAADVVFS
jgi:hypothetical protein